MYDIGPGAFGVVIIGICCAFGFVILAWKGFWFALALVKFIWHYFTG